MLDAATQSVARKSYLIEEPVAAAIGAGIDITLPCGNMVVDIGGGTTDIAVLSLKDIAVSTSIKVAGDVFDESIVKYIRRKYSILVGERTAENIKMKIGCVYPREEKLSMQVKGRSLLSGLPSVFELTSDEILEALKEPAQQIYDAVHSVLERTPPELIGDISTNGIVLTGGGSLVYGMDKYISKLSGIPARVADDPVCCVAKGTGKALENLSVLQDGLLYLSRSRQANRN